MSAYKNYLSSNIENFNLILSEMPENIIRQITFSLYSTEEIDKYAVVDINNNSATGAGSVRDPRLGAHSNSSKCDVCSKGMSECIGHYGKIRIPPLMNPIATKAIASVLTSVCNSCGKLLVSVKDLERRNIFRFKKENRLDKIKTIVVSEKKRCTNKQCQINPIYSVDSKNSYYLNMKIGDNQVSKIVPVKMLEILNRIDDETAFNLGFEDSH